jgi:hypothetical protein
MSFSAWSRVAVLVPELWATGHWRQVLAEGIPLRQVADRRRAAGPNGNRLTAFILLKGHTSGTTIGGGKLIFTAAMQSRLPSRIKTRPSIRRAGAANGANRQKADAARRRDGGTAVYCCWGGRTATDLAGALSASFAERTCLSVAWPNPAAFTTDTLSRS